MIWKFLALAILAVGALAEYEVTDAQKQQVRAVISQYCKKNGAEDKATDIEKGVQTFVDCLKSLMNPEDLKKEIEEAKPRGELDEVFKKYCAKSPQLKSCIHSFTDTLLPCIDSSIREHMPAAKNATDQLIDFICYKDGDRIALFIAENGPECFQEKINEIRQCSEKIRANVPDTEAAKKLTLTEQCAKFDELSSCVVKSLEGCKTPTPGNMAESLFRFVKKGSPCTENK